MDERPICSIYRHDGGADVTMSSWNVPRFIIPRITETSSSSSRVTFYTCILRNLFCFYTLEPL
jgi:hypothetical protein